MREWDNGGLAFLLVGLILLGAGSLFLAELVSAPPVSGCYWVDFSCAFRIVALEILLGFAAISGMAMCIYGAVSYFETGRGVKGSSLAGNKAA